MFDYIIHAALKQRLLVLGISLLLIIYGALTLRLEVSSETAALA